MYQIIDLYDYVDAWKWNDTCTYFIGEVGRFFNW